MSEFTPSHPSSGDHQTWEALMPFYLARTLPEAQARALAAHLMTCDDCREALEEWGAIANATHHLATERASQLPPLSPALRQQVQQEGLQRSQKRDELTPRLMVMPRHTVSERTAPRSVPTINPVTPVTSVVKMRTGRDTTAVWLMRTAATFALVIVTGIVLLSARDGLMTLTNPSTAVAIIIDRATLTPSVEASILMEKTAEAGAQSDTPQPTSTPWNTVMPIQQSATPTFTITPRSALTETTQAVIPVRTSSQPTSTPTPLSVAASSTATRPRPFSTPLRATPLADAEPTVRQFNAVPNTIRPGQTITLHWQTTGADRIEIAADYQRDGDFRVIHISDVSVDSVSVSLPTEVREQVVFELRLYRFNANTTPNPSMTAEATSLLTQMPVIASERVSVAVQCPYIYLLYGNQCPDADTRQFTGIVQRFERGWILRRSDVGEGVVLLDNGTVTANAPAQSVPQGMPPVGLLTPDPAFAAFYQTDLGWAAASAEEVVISVLKTDADPVDLVNDLSQWFEVRLHTTSAGEMLLTLEIEWLQTSTSGNFSQWRSVS